MNPRKLEHGFRMNSAGIPNTLRGGHKDNDLIMMFLLSGLYFTAQDPLRSRKEGSAVQDNVRVRAKVQRSAFKAQELGSEFGVMA